MPPKNKSRKQDWYECSKCSYIIPERETETHSDTCDNAEEIGKHPHILYGVFNGVTSLQSIEKDSTFPSSFKDKIICIHPSAMQLCGLAIGKPCIVNGKVILIAWPSKSGPVSWLTVSAKVMSETGCKKGELISVTRLWADNVFASEVHLFGCDWKEFYSQTEFIYHVKLKLEREFVMIGSKIEIHYFGQLCQFSVHKVVPGTVQTHQTEVIQRIGDNTSNLSESMASLDISDISLDSDSILNQSTNSIQSDIELTTSPITRTPEKKQTNRSQFHTPIAKYCQFKTKTSEFYKINKVTKIVISNSNCDQSGSNERKTTGICFSDIGGLQKQMDSIKEMLQLPLTHPQLFQSYGLSPPRGILLFGPSGTGKTLLSKALVNEMKIHTIHVTGPQVWSKYFGETEAKLRNIFLKARESAPSLIIIDEIDALCPKRENSQSELEKRVVASLLTLMDGIDMNEDKSYVVVVGVTSKIDALDSSLRRPGRFDREIEIGVPNANERLDIIKKILRKVPHMLTHTDLMNIAQSAHGFVGADLSSVFKEAGIISIKKQCKDAKDISISQDDIKKALLLVKPSAMREIRLEVPQVFWTDVGGQDELKLKLKQAIEWPLQHPEAFTRLGVQPPRGLLMYGPPGCSKTLIAKALATESGLNFIAVKGPELFSKWVGESERAVREVFRKARSAAPSIIFFDEIDALAVERGSSSGGSNVADRVLAQLLTEIDGIENLQDVTIVAATNRPDMIDKALLRPGRIDRILYVPLPTEETRKAILDLKFKTMPISDDVNIQYLVDKTNFYSGAEVTAVCHEAALAALQEDINGQVIQHIHFDQALLAVPPRTSKDAISFYENYHNQSGLHSI